MDTYWRSVADLCEDAYNNQGGPGGVRKIVGPSAQASRKGQPLVETRWWCILAVAMTLTVFQVGTDDENSQVITAEFDVRLLEPPADGESVAGRPWPSTFWVFDRDCPRANFYDFYRSFLVMDSKAMSLCRSALERCGEFVRFNVTDLGSVYLYNPWRTLSQDAVDWSKTQGTLGVYSNLTLNKELIPPASIFRLPRMRNLYVSSRLREDEDDFVYLYRKHGLTGLHFKKLWDESAGPVPRRSTQRGQDN